MDHDESVDPVWYREVMGHYPTGVAVVTGTDDAGGPVGMVIGTFASVSVDPPLVSFMPTRSSATLPACTPHQPSASMSWPTTNSMCASG